MSVATPDLKKIKVLATTVSYLPGYRGGGTVQSLSRWVDSGGDFFDFSLLTYNNDSHDQKTYDQVPADQWTEFAGAQVFYMSPRRRRIRDLIQILCTRCKDKDFDFYLLNSFFSPYLTFTLLLLRKLGLIPMRPVLLLPRGEFSVGALALKAWKKKIYIFVFRALGLGKDIVWQFSTENEANDFIFKNAKDQQTLLMRDLLGRLNQTKPMPARQKRPGELNLVFLSRLAPIKNLKYLLEVLRQLNLPVNLKVWGPIQDQNYWQECQTLAGQNSQLIFHSAGEVSPDQLSRVFSEAHLLCLPTLGENFGHVIVESLAHATPVMISDQTPWRNLDAAKAGIDLALDDQRVHIEFLRKFHAMDQSEWDAWSQGALTYFKTIRPDQEICLEHYQQLKARLAKTEI